MAMYYDEYTGPTRGRSRPQIQEKKKGMLGSLGKLFSRLNPKEKNARRPIRRSSSDAGDLYEGYERNFGKGVRASFHMVSPYDNISPNSVFSGDGLQMSPQKASSVPSRPVNEAPSFELPDRPRLVRPSLENIFDIHHDSKQKRPNDSSTSSKSLSDRRLSETSANSQPQSRIPLSRPRSSSQESSQSSEREPDLIIRQRSSSSSIPNDRRRSLGEESMISTASASSERSQERSHRRLAGRKLLTPLQTPSATHVQNEERPHRRQRSLADPRYLPPPPLIIQPQPYQGVYPYSYPPLAAVGFLPYYIPYAEEVPVLNAIKEEGSTQGSDVSLSLSDPTINLPGNFPPSYSLEYPPEIVDDYQPNYPAHVTSNFSPDFQSNFKPKNNTPKRSKTQKDPDPPAGLDDFVLY